MDLQNVIVQYLPGLEYLLFLLFVHISISTICHLKDKTFTFNDWPNYMINFMSYALFIGLVNGAIIMIRQYLTIDIVEGLLYGLQGLVYGQVIFYYLSNIIKHLKELNQPVGEAVGEIVNNMSEELKEKILNKGDRG